MSDSTYYLYTSIGCHLCEQAEALLKLFMGEQYHKLAAVEISDSDDLVASYGLRIPVLAASSNSGEWMELGWPFGVEELEDFFRALRS